MLGRWKKLSQVSPCCSMGEVQWYRCGHGGSTSTQSSSCRKLFTKLAARIYTSRHRLKPSPGLTVYSRYLVPSPPSCKAKAKDHRAHNTSGNVFIFIVTSPVSRASRSTEVTVYAVLKHGPIFVQAKRRSSVPEDISGEQPNY